MFAAILRAFLYPFQRDYLVYDKLLFILWQLTEGRHDISWLELWNPKHDASTINILVDGCFNFVAVWTTEFLSLSWFLFITNLALHFELFVSLSLITITNPPAVIFGDAGSSSNVTMFYVSLLIRSFSSFCFVAFAFCEVHLWSFRATISQMFTWMSLRIIYVDLVLIEISWL